MRTIMSPVKDPEESKPPVASKCSQSGSHEQLFLGRRILVVDDSATARLFTATVLTQAGYEVETANNIWISSLVSTFHPDLILMDVHLGPSQGTAAVRALNNRAFTHRALIVLYSTLGLDELELLAKECGADGVITKKKDPDYLLRQVRRCFVEGALRTAAEN